jgi:hypothetical protein
VIDAEVTAAALQLDCETLGHFKCQRSSLYTCSGIVDGQNHSGASFINLQDALLRGTRRLLVVVRVGSDVQLGVNVGPVFAHYRDVCRLQVSEAKLGDLCRKRMSASRGEFGGRAISAHRAPDVFEHLSRGEVALARGGRRGGELVDDGPDHDERGDEQ